MYNVTGGCGAVASLPDITFRLDGADYALSPQQYIAKVPASVCCANVIIVVAWPRCAVIASFSMRLHVLHAAAGEHPRVLHLCNCRRRRPALSSVRRFLHARILLDIQRQQGRPGRHDRAGRISVKTRLRPLPLGLFCHCVSSWPESQLSQTRDELAGQFLSWLTSKCQLDMSGPAMTFMCP